MRVPRPGLPPGLRLARGYHRDYLPGDLGAGILVAALAVPQALGYAVVAGVPVEVGLYTLPPALLAYALYGTSRLLFVGPVSTVSVLSGSIVRALSGGDPEHAVALTSALAIVAGVVLIVAGAFKMGWMARFLSEPIVTGFVAGLVVLIVVGEIPGLAGLTPPTGSLLDRLVVIGQTLPGVHLTTFAVGAGCLVLLFGGQRLAPRIPWALVALLGSIAASHSFDLAARGVAVVGEVPRGLPLPVVPVLPLQDWAGLLTGGMAIAAVGIAEGLAAARTFLDSQRHRLHDDGELVANGVADLAAGLFGGMGVAGSLSKTAANARAGAHTQVSSLSAAVVVLLVLVALADLLPALPKAALSAIVINAVWGLVRLSAFRHFQQVRQLDFVASVVAFCGVLALGPLNGLLLAIGQSLLGLIYRSLQVDVDQMGKIAGEKAAWGPSTMARTGCRTPGCWCSDPTVCCSGPTPVMSWIGWRRSPPIARTSSRWCWTWSAATRWTPPRPSAWTCCSPTCGTPTRTCTWCGYWARCARCSNAPGSSTGSAPGTSGIPSPPESRRPNGRRAPRRNRAPPERGRRPRGQWLRTWSPRSRRAPERRPAHRRRWRPSPRCPVPPPRPGSGWCRPGRPPRRIGP